MSKFKGELRFSAAVLAIAAMSAPAVATAQDQGNGAESGEGIGDIVVTAQRREQNLQDVPVAVTAFSGDTMADLGIQSSSDIAGVVPNLEIGLPGGEGNQPLIYIRGVGLADTNSNNAGPNGVYVDEVYIASPGAQTFQLFDLDRVEVLKGPQGTLYGRNATGGAINFITAKPSQDFQAQASLSYGSFDTITGEAAIGGPISDAVRFRISGTGTHANGYVHNLLTGRRENGQGSFALRGQLALDITDNFDALLNVHGGKVDVRSPQYRSLGLLDPDTGFTTPCAPDAIMANQCGNVFGYVSPEGFYDGNYDRSDRLVVKNWGTSARLNWHFGDITLTSISAYDWNDKLHREDTDASPFRLLDIDYGVRSKAFTQELRLSGTGGGVNWVVGGYYLHERLDQNQTGDLFGEVRAALPGGAGDPDGVATGGVPVLFSRTLNRQTTDAASIFGQAEIELTPALRATIGGRYNYERKRFQAALQLEENEILALDDDDNVVVVPIPGGVIPVYAFDNRKSFKNVSFKVGLDYDIAPDVMAYASISTGFKSGGFNGGFLSFDPAEAAVQAQPFEEETLTAYEVGLKSTLFDRRLRFNAAAFYYDYKDLQLYTLINTGAIPLSLLDNAANATIYGAEFEVIAKPADRFDITLNLGLLDTEVKDFVTATADYSGNRLALSPTVTFSGTANYEVPVSAGLAIAFQPSASYRSGQYFSADNNPLLKQKGYWLLGGRIALKDEDGRWEAAVFGRNLTRKKYINYAVDLSDFGFIEQFRGEPRMFGVEFRVKY
ncbi:TonB-dependent receptor [Sphingopyxis sp.]|uniref:TonB-dependent receptor n=1 Tax=Sphingopyxis sp. TaxID=1908224 RepID=UPI002629994F|nr:TonB-dependent receptor [Sphingopyxis sp.]MCW0199742.1 TonB-dependent receptor [Sphingopyxis sp.]